MLSSHDPATTELYTLSLHDALPISAQAIYDGLRWLGLDWDEGPHAGGNYGPYFQSQREEIYQSYLERLRAADRVYDRSEEHTSELQSRLHLVCRLLLEKKKRKTSSL